MIGQVSDIVEDNTIRYFYGSEVYVRNSLANAESLYLDDWRCAILSVKIPGTSLSDCRAAYPLFAVREDAVRAGLDDLRESGLVSFAAVADPFQMSPGGLGMFGICRPYKSLFYIERAKLNYCPSLHHQKEIKRAYRKNTFSVVKFGKHIEEWEKLYSGQVAERNWSTIHKFTNIHWQDIAEKNVLSCIRAVNSDGNLAALALFVECGDCVYYHLAASNDLGRRSGAAYGILDFAIRLFADRQYFILGGAPGASNDLSSGLARFKSGFSAESRLSHIIGEILSPDDYKFLSFGRTGNFFPLYRAPDSQSSGT